MIDVLHGLLGIAVILALAWALSERRSAISWQTIGVGVALQFSLAVFVLWVPFGQVVFDRLGALFVTLIGYTSAGSSFIFGDFANPEAFGFIFAFQVLPTIIFFAALMACLYHLGLMQKLVEGMAWVMTRLMKVSGSESLATAANVFVGQTEAPLVVRPFIAGMTRSELFALMTGGMATIAGGVLAAYVLLLGGASAEEQAFFAKHLISASIMAAPAALVMAKLIIPETAESETVGTVRTAIDRPHVNLIEAAAGGAGEGLKLALNVGAMLLAFLALIALVNGPLGWLGAISGLEAWLGQPLSLELILGWVFAPLAFLVGVPLDECVAVGGLIGQKIVANEFVAYVALSEAQVNLSDRSVLIATYALCGFANFSSIAIQIGGVGSISPSRRPDLARLGLKAVLAGALVSLLNAAWAGILVG
ncbi:NupC/NupG family nucleoside CNT transporter [Wenzhouxiangella marina]|uniref:Na+ dependent nucleoside transporter domain-containing protein n=1 Tax=Wenzhouxiangella marina TaxID=1579979 RepID=A0A0K0XSH0_9GAMM|nr:nucleoside transporter C-terminal domain-containing protein [Wenzhouxiangella marina]AKS40659.1 Na+ dependent nucleoside transporter domain-containing protein [Wenzhouxiangella marina]MBB6088429.1 CNT family concentrative nucleoside transporter [Wenzhouxiangella marina]